MSYEERPIAKSCDDVEIEERPCEEGGDETIDTTAEAADTRIPNDTERHYKVNLDFKVADGVPTLDVDGTITGKFDDEANPLLAAIAEFRNK